MNIIDGFSYNFRGLLLGMKTPKLLLFGADSFPIGNNHYFYFRQHYSHLLSGDSYPNLVKTGVQIHRLVMVSSIVACSYSSSRFLSCPFIPGFTDHFWGGDNG